MAVTDPAAGAQLAPQQAARLDGEVSRGHGEKVNGRLMNGAAMVYLVLVVVASVAAIPLMIVTGGGS